MKEPFGNEYTESQRRALRRLASIESEDAAACDSCGGEDCQCCEIYHNRQKWQSQEDLYSKYY